MSTEHNGIRTRKGEYYVRSGADEREVVPLNNRPQDIADVLHPDKNTKKHDDGWKGERDAYVVYSKLYPSAKMILDPIPLKTQKLNSVGTTDTSDLDRVQVWCHYCVPVGGLGSVLSYEDSGIAEYVRVWEINDNEHGLNITTGRQHETVLVDLVQDSTHGMYKSTLQGSPNAGITTSTTSLSSASTARLATRPSRGASRLPGMPPVFPDEPTELNSVTSARRAHQRPPGTNKKKKKKKVKKFLKVDIEQIDFFAIRRVSGVAAAPADRFRGNAAVQAFINAENARTGRGLVGKKINGMNIVLNATAMSSLESMLAKFPLELGDVGLFPHREGPVGTSSYRLTTTGAHQNGTAIDLYTKKFEGLSTSKKKDFLKAYVHHVMNNSSFKTFGFHDIKGVTHIDLRTGRSWLYIRPAIKRRIVRKIMRRLPGIAQPTVEGALNVGGSYTSLVDARAFIEYLFTDPHVMKVLPDELLATRSKREFQKVLESFKDPKYSAASLGIT